MNEIRLNSVDLNITQIEYRPNGAASALRGSFEVDEEDELVIIKFPEPLQVDRKQPCEEPAFFSRSRRRVMDGYIWHSMARSMINCMDSIARKISSTSVPVHSLK